MNKNIFLSTMLCGLCLAPFSDFANDKVTTAYNPQKYQQVCKGKSQGAPVSFAYRGIIWNGTCQMQFIPSSSNTKLTGDEPELNSICQSDPKSTSINIEGHVFKGKCALGFTPPRPA